jgi:lipoyl(octanoyl) transferase
MTNIGITFFTARPIIMVTQNIRSSHEVDLAIDNIAGLLRLEFQYIAGTNALASSTYEPSNNALLKLPKIHAHWRPTIFEWFYKIIDHFLLERGVVAIAMDYVDRYFFHLPPSDVDFMSITKYQLVAMTSLYIAMKLHGGNETGDETSPWKIKRKTFCVKGFAKLSRGQFVPDDILTMESLIFKNLEWKMNPVTAMCCMDSYMGSMPSPEEMCSLHSQPALSRRDLARQRLGFHVLRELARYLVELAVCIKDITPYFETDYSGSSINSIAPSMIAYAGILLAMDMMTKTAVTNRGREIFIERVAKAQSIMINEEKEMPSYEEAYMRFKPNRLEVLKIKNLIHKNFVPSLVLPNGGTGNVHPFKLAHKAGMFNARFYQKHNEGQPKSPTSPLEEEEMM